MTKTRLETFSDGVLAIILTIMVLELDVPESFQWEHLEPLFNTLLSYLLSFALVVIYWWNHHHLLHTIKHVNTRIIWSNTHLLLWLSLVPFATKWLGESGFERNPVIIYAALNVMCAMAYTILQKIILRSQSFSDVLLRAMSRQAIKGMISTSAYVVSIGLAFIDTRLSGAVFVVIPVIWFIPDKTIEKAVGE